MSTAVRRPTVQESFERIRNRLSVNVLGGAQVVPETPEWYVATNELAAEQFFYSLADQQWRERDPRYACCDNLIEIAAFDGIYPRPAAHAQGFVTITGRSDTAIPRDLQFAVDDNVYAIDNTTIYPAVMPGAGEVTVRVTAETPGESGNIIAGTRTGTITNPPAGLDTTITIAGGNFCGGSKAEDCEAFRQRYLERMKFKPRFDLARIEQDLLEYPCATRVCRRTCTCCPEIGLLEYYVFFDNTFDHGVPPPEIADDISNWYFGTPVGAGRGRAEWGIVGGIFVPSVEVMDINLRGVPCLADNPSEVLRQRLAGVFDNFCPGDPICPSAFISVATQLLGETAGCNMSVDMVLRSDPDGLALCDYYEPGCDVALVAGNVTIESE